MTKIILYIATSLDGFIADKEGGVDWLPHPNDDADDMGYKALIDSIDTIIMGSRSYEQILTFGPWAWPEKSTYVFTSKQLTTDRSDIFFVHENVGPFMDKLRAKKTNQAIWLLGGAELVKSFSDLNLIDECVITILPTVLKEGIPLSLSYEGFNLIKTKETQDDIIQKTFVRKDGEPTNNF